MWNPDICRKILPITCLAIISAACSHQTIPLKSIYSSNDCAISEPMLKSISSASELDRLLKSFPRTFSNPPPTNTRIDFQKQSVIFFALGQKPSSGYDIELKKNFAILKREKLYLPIRIQQPGKNSFQAQIITSPCRIFSIPKTDFEEILISDF